MRSSLLCRAAIALPVFITAAVLAGSAASVTACALWIDGDAGVAAMTVTGVVAVAVWRSGVRIWTRPRDHRSVHGVPLPDDSPVSELVAIESARLPLALAEVCATLGSGVQVDRGVLEIGIGALAAASEVELRIEIAASLRRLKQ